MSFEVKLQRNWVAGDQIGRGGFGRVFSAAGPDGQRAVVKLVPKEPGADRELLFVNLSDARNVVPIIDSGEIGDDWALVMPRAEKSLRQHLDETQDPLTTAEVIAILSDIAAALADLDGKVVHRDLKPENVLLLNGAWSLADFGISRYAEASTAADTQKYALSPPYAAPERWRNERANASTDVYSLGVIAFELLNRRRPFPGPTVEDFREQHLHTDAPDLKVGPTALRAVISECLYKAAGARPSPGNVLARLQRVGRQSTSSGLAKLGEANLAEVARRSESERLASEMRSVAERRADLFDSATKSLQVLEESLIEAISDAAPAAGKQLGRRGGATISLANATLEFASISQTTTNPWNWETPGFDVVAHTSLGIKIPPTRYGYQGRSHSLWFCDALVEGRYQWFETAFMITPLMRGSSATNPFALAPGKEAAKAFWNGMAEYQLAWTVDPLDISDLDNFIDRWANWFADAAKGHFESPSSMPERHAQRNWRKK